jgi:hypothetical protein
MLKIEIISNRGGNATAGSKCLEKDAFLPCCRTRFMAAAGRIEA